MIISGKNNFDLNNNLYQHYLLGYVFILVMDLRMCKQCSIIIGIHVYVCVRAYVRVYVYMWATVWCVHACVCV